MGFRCGIVGLPNVGKSTLFNLLTDSEADAANYPFCTIKANIGIAEVSDYKLRKVAKIAGARAITPTVLELVDIAGLVRGAAKGEGLGNRFLADVRNVEALTHVTRCFSSEEITHVDGTVAPARDAATIRDELILADLSLVEKRLEKCEKAAKSGDRRARAAVKALVKLCEMLADGLSPPQMKLDKEDAAVSDELDLLSSKPEILIANMADNDERELAHLRDLSDYAAQYQIPVLPVSLQLECELRSLPENEKREFLSESGYQSGSLERIVAAGYELLDLLTFYTAGEKEARAWTVAKGSDARRAAGKVHSDFVRSFIRAEVVSYSDYVNYHGMANARRAGKVRMEGKNYLVEEGDIIYFHCQ